MNYYNNEKYIPLHFATENRAPAHVVKRLIEYYPNGVYEKDANGKLPLHFAALNHASDDVVKMLLDAYPGGAKTVDNNGNLPLHLACLEGASPEVMLLLIHAHPGGMKVMDKTGTLPLQALLTYKHCDYKHSVAQSRVILEAFPELVKEQDIFGDLPLHWAAQYKTANEVKLLLEYYPEGAKTKNTADCLPLYKAFMYNRNVDVLRVLIKAHPWGVMDCLKDTSVIEMPQREHMWVLMIDKAKVLRRRVRWALLKAAVKLLGVHKRAVVSANNPKRKRDRGEFDSDEEDEEL
jgi:ankyrin repeat protein